MTARLGVRATALAVLAGAALTIAGAYVFQYGLGYQPCKLCLQQRIPYYVAMPLAALAALLPVRLGRVLLALAGLSMLVGVGLGAYHAGVEWGFWAGPSDCGGAAGAAPGGVGGLLQSLETIRVVSCTEAAWRFLGLSLAGWNVLIAAALALLAGAAALRGDARPAWNRARSP